MAEEGQETTQPETKVPVAEAAVATPVEPIVISETTLKADRPKPKKRKRWVAWTLGTIAVLAILGAVGWKLKWYTPITNRLNAASVTVKVREDEQYVLADAVVTFRGATYTSDASGQVNIPQTTAGNWSLVVTKAGYITYDGNLTLKKGDNGTVFVSVKKEPEKLYAVSGLIDDYVSTTALTDVQISLAGTAAKTDAGGGFSFSKLAAGDYQLTASKTGFVTLTQTVTIKAQTNGTLKLALVPSGRVLFVSNRGGKRAIYWSGYDGQNQQQLVPPVDGTEDFGPSISPDGKFVVFSSTRDKIADTFGSGFLPRLYIVGIDGKDLKKINDDVSPSKVVWGASSRFLYFEAYSDAKQTTATRRFYDVSKGSTFDLGEDAESVTLSHAGIHALYAVSRQPDPSNYTYVEDIKVLDLISGQRRTLVSGITDYYSAEPMTFSIDDKIITYQTQGTDGRKRFQADFLNGATSQIGLSTEATHNYVVSPDGSLKAFIDTRDGKVDLFAVDAQGKNEVRLTTLGVVSATEPVTWDATGHYLTFAVVKEGESAIYIVNSSGGAVQKVVDFTPDSQPIPYY